MAAGCTICISASEVFARQAGDMGICHCSAAKHCDPEEGGNCFRVINVNDNGKNVCPGIMELTETTLIFHIRRGGFVRWPYISLLKYGYDTDLFSFVCGRRCQTGEGIFGFRCNRAEELFNLLQICMKNNRISVISDTDGDSPVDAEQSFPYRYETYPTLPATSLISSTIRPEPIGSECITSSSSTRTSENCKFPDYNKMKRSNLPQHHKLSDGGMSQMSMQSYLNVDEHLGLGQACMVGNTMKSEALQTLSSIQSGDLNGAIWDTGYDSDDRQESSCVRRMGYENVSAIPGACLRSRSMLVSFSSSESQSSDNLTPDISGCVNSKASSPSITEQNIASMKEDSSSLDTEKLSSARDSKTRQGSAPIYFNFDVRQSSQESKTLNYIQVEMESGIDSDNPETPQSPDVQWSMCRQSQIYTELDLAKTTALSLIQRNWPKEDGTRKTRHNGKPFPV
ncbi:fibroblast growth factor receptor substrate 2-like isoform X2 [Ranitomeya variabilis]|uniref:fibroblast growth factor receptor substrate 2-like isoform X2 n=2 Tax=Ranitomeya variabilis TaxID=490064 RepID=UPI0040560647